VTVRFAPTAAGTFAGNVNFTANSTTNLTANTDITWKYEFVQEPYDMAHLLAFTGNNSAGTKESWVCLGGASGEFDIPATTMASFPISGVLQGATVVHQKINNNGRVLDVIGVTCAQAAYAIQ